MNALENGKYKITNPKNGSFLLVNIDESDDVSVCQYDVNNNQTAQLIYGKLCAARAIHKAVMSGMIVTGGVK